MRWHKCEYRENGAAVYEYRFSDKEQSEGGHHWINAAFLAKKDGGWELKIWDITKLGAESNLTGFGEWSEPIKFTSMKAAKAAAKLICAVTNF